MSPEPNQTISRPAPPPEPKAKRNPAPVWLFVLLFILLYWGMVYFDQRSGWFSTQVYLPYRSLVEVQKYQPATGGANLERGRSVYENVCALCHNTDGHGKPGQAPSFVGSEWVTGSPGRLIRIPLVGLAGPITVKGQVWSEAPAMPAMGAALSDEDLAAVLSYMRQSWGNKAEPITPDQVKAVRAEVGGRTQPFTADQLSSIQ